MAYLLTCDWQAVSAVATVVTGGVVAWYTWETQQLREISQRQLETSYHPVLAPSFDGQSDAIWLKNVGLGSAFVIEIEGFREQNVSKFATEVRLDPNDKPIPIRLPDINGYKQSIVHAFRETASDGKDPRLSVRCKDLAGQPHTRIYILRKHGDRFIFEPEGDFRPRNVRK